MRLCFLTDHFIYLFFVAGSFHIDNKRELLNEIDYRCACLYIVKFLVISFLATFFTQLSFECSFRSLLVFCRRGLSHKFALNGDTLKGFSSTKWLTVIIKIIGNGRSKRWEWDGTTIVGIHTLQLYLQIWIFSMWLSHHVAWLKVLKFINWSNLP